MAAGGQVVVVCAKGAVVCATGAVVYVKGQLPEVVEGVVMVAAAAVH